MVLALGLAAACTGGDGDDQARPTTTAPPEQTMEITLAEVISPHRAVSPLDRDTVFQVASTVQAFYEATVARPARTGKPGEIDDLVMFDVLDLAEGRDHGALFDDGLGRVRGGLRGSTQLQLRALAGDDDRPALVVAGIAWVLSNGAGDVRVRRTGELTLLPVDGRWRVAGYELLVERDVGGSTTSTTAAGGAS